MGFTGKQPWELLHEEDLEMKKSRSAPLLPAHGQHFQLCPSQTLPSQLQGLIQHILSSWNLLSPVLCFRPSERSSLRRFKVR